MSVAEANLRSAIEQSYETFAGIPCPRKLDASPYRNADEILRTLTSAPLRELDAERIGPYAGWAITTVGNDSDYRHFLPRIFELAVTDPVWLGADPPVMARKLNMGGWRTWPANQQSAVLHVFHAALTSMTERHPDNWPSTAADWFCGIATLGEPVTPAFECWRASTHANAALNMAGFIISESKNIRRNGMVRCSFWHEVNEEVRREVAKLLLEKRTKVFLQSAMDQVSEDDCFFHLDAALAEIARKF